jgi:hypothetical protein
VFDEKSEKVSRIIFGGTYDEQQIRDGYKLFLAHYQSTTTYKGLEYNYSRNDNELIVSIVPSSFLYFIYPGNCSF